MNSDLNNLSFDEIKKDGQITVKKTQWESKAEWVKTNIDDIYGFFGSIENQVTNGVYGLWMQPYIDYFGALLYMPILDVEHPENHHESPWYNINVAKGLFYRFNELGLTQDLTVGLTGKGFRFSWPWVIPHQYTNAFLVMVKDSERFYGIDPAPQKGKDKFLRTMAYRGNNNQGAPTQNTHIYYLDHASQISDLTEAEYKKLVRGRPAVEGYKSFLPRLMPNKFAPREFLEVLETYQFQLRIKSTIATPAAPRIAAKL